MLTRVSRLLVVLAAALTLCQGCASTPPPNPNFSAAAVMNPAPPKAGATTAAIAKAASTGVLLDRIVAGILGPQDVKQINALLLVPAPATHLTTQYPPGG